MKKMMRLLAGVVLFFAVGFAAVQAEEVYPGEIFVDTSWAADYVDIVDSIWIYNQSTLTIGGGEHFFQDIIEVGEGSKIVFEEGSYTFGGEITLNAGSEMVLKKGTYVFEKNVFLNDGAKLRIGKGVNVKFKNVDGVTPSFFVDRGFIEAYGTAEERISFSSADENSNDYSIYLQGYAGDNVSVFNFVDFIGGGKKWSTGGGGTMSFLRMFVSSALAAEQFSGEATLEVSNSRVIVSNSKFEKGNFFAINSSLYIGTRFDEVKYLKVSDSDFVGNQNYLAVRSYVNCAIGAINCSNNVVLENNWYGSTDGPKTTGHPERGGDLVTGFEVMDWSPVAHFPDVDPNAASNVLFLPGLKASRLYSDMDSTCPYDGNNKKKAWEPNCNEDVRGLYLDINGESLDLSIHTNDGDVVDETPSGANIYKSFIEKMNEMKNTDKVINDWKPVAYDWRLSLDDILNDGEIVNQLRDLAKSSKTQKVTIVAHSNGGLLAKALMQRLGYEETSKLVDKIIFVAVPQVGTPAAIAGLLHGEDQNFFPVLDVETARGFGENMSGAYNLLPSEKYFSKIKTPVIDFKTEQSPDWKDLFDVSIDSSGGLHEFLADDFRRVSAVDSDVNTPAKLNEQLLSSAENVHADLDSWTAPAGVKVIQIAGWGVPNTLSSTEYGILERTVCDESVCQSGVDYLNPDFKFTIDGDGTVVTPTALWMDGVERYWVDLGKWNKNHPFSTGFGFNSHEHANILETQELLNFVNNLIKNTNIDLPQYISNSIPSIDGNPKRLQYSLHSPLSMELIDGQGRHTGINAEGQIEEQIPGTYFKQFGDVKYIFADEDISSRIKMQGYATGTFTFAVEEFKGDESLGKITFKDVPTTSETKVSFEVATDLESASNLEIDKNGDDIVDVNLAPKIDEIVFFDGIAPTTSNSLSGTLGENDWYTSDVSLNLSVRDNENGSGVEKTEFSLDNGATWNRYADPIVFAEEGIFNVSFFSTDKQGNAEDAKTVTIKIDKTATEAKIQFNSVAQKLEVVGVDNLSQNVAVQISEKTIIDSTHQKDAEKKFWFFHWTRRENEKKIIVTATLTDEAGHKTEIIWEKKNDKDRRINLSISSISYDGHKAEILRNNLQYKWMLDWRRKKYALLASSVSNNLMSVESHYVPKKYQTLIMEKPRELGDDDNDDDSEKRPIKKKMSGMVIPGIMTEKGLVKIYY